MRRPTPARPVLARLRATRDSLTPALARIADAVLAGPDAVLAQTITELADQAGASEASAIRLCRDLGFAGYQDFKLALATELAIARPPGPAAAADSAAEAVAALVRAGTSALEDTRGLLDAALLDAVAERLAAARTVALFGVGASGVTARYGFYKLVRLGIAAAVHDDAHLAAMAAGGLGPADVAVAVSSSGSTVDTVRAAGLARGAGAYVVALTNRLRSPLTAAADAVLLAAAPETPLTGGAFPSKIGQMLILDALFTTVAARHAGRRAAIRRTAEAVSDRSF